MGLPSFLWFAIPGFVDLAILVYKAAEIRLKQDDRRRHLAWKANLGVIGFTTLSSTGNVLHVISLNETDPIKFWGGIIFAATAPWAIYLAASVLTDMVIKPKPQKHEAVEVRQDLESLLMASTIIKEQDLVTTQPTKFAESITFEVPPKTAAPEPVLQQWPGLGGQTW